MQARHTQQLSCHVHLHPLLCRPADSSVRYRRRPLSIRAQQQDSNSSNAAGPQQQQSTPSVSAAAQTSSPGPALAGIAVALGAAVFAATRLTAGGPSFAELERSAVPIDVALANGRPTVIEMFAPWCEVCRELLPDTYEVEQQFQGRVNFVALNIENAKWTPEVLQFGVRGIPHYVFLDAQGRQQAAAVGRLPREVLEGNMSALAAGEALPYARASGATSSLQRPSPSKQALPRDHA